MTTLSPTERDALLAGLEARFEAHMHRHPGMSWEKDCSPESPRRRRSVCYDPEALEARKKHKPAHSAVGMAAARGALFGDCRYGTVFLYHNGAESYYAARGFRCALRV